MKSRHTHRWITGPDRLRIRTRIIGWLNARVMSTPRIKFSASHIHSMRTGVCQSYQNHSKLICVNPQLTAVQRWTEDGDSVRKMLKASLSWAWIISFASSKQTSELVKDWTLRREEKRKKTQKLQPDKKRRKNTNSTSHKSSLNWVLETWFSTPRLTAQRVVSRVKDLTSGQEDDKLKFQRQRRYTFELKEI